jgi:small subunit ribosomal protein S8
MSVCDTLGDSLTRVRNGQMARLPMVNVIYSKMVMSVLQILRDEGYVASFEVNPDARSVCVVLKYVAGNVPVIKKLQRVSKPGCRVYVSKDKIGAYYRGLGIDIISTSRGVMPSYLARESGVGGEVLCRVF